VRTILKLFNPVKTRAENYNGETETYGQQSSRAKE